jgi:hypothetical protein
LTWLQLSHPAPSFPSSIDVGKINEWLVYSLPASQPRVIFAFRSGDDHLPARKDQRRRLRVSDSHNDGSEPFGVIFCVSGVEGDRLEVEPAVEVDGRDDIPSAGGAVVG